MIRIITILFLFLSTWAGAQHGMLLAKPAATGTTYLLDTYTGAAAAYAMNKLKSDATNCVTILRASDNDTLVVGFSGGDFDSSAATTFVSSGHGYVITWWDQSGNGKHAIQSDTSQAPRIIINGALVTDNSFPAIDGDETDQMSMDQVYTGASHTTFVVSNFETSNAFEMLVTQSDAASETGGQIEIRRRGGLNGIDYLDGVKVQASTTAVNSQFLGTFNRAGSGGSVTMRINGSDVASGTSNTNVAQTRSTLIMSRGGTRLDGKMQLIIIYNSDQSANISNIETEINNYYSIY